jgi:hypothetical protein
MPPEAAALRQSSALAGRQRFGVISFIGGASRSSWLI